MNWIEHRDVRRHGWADQPLPEERRYVLCRLDTDVNSYGAVVVGYLRYAAGDKTCPYFVCGGVPGSGTWEVTHWCDCLPVDFAWPKKNIRPDQPSRPRRMSGEPFTTDHHHQRA